MGRKSKYLIVLMLMIHVASHGQERKFSYTDSLTYDLYISGKWDQLISEAEDAIRSGIDYKYLRQRVAYAYFEKGDYYRSSAHFRKALEYDSSDQFTLEYLWLSYLYSGKEEYAGRLEKNMFPDLKRKLSIKRFSPAESIDIEYDHKFSTSGFRSDANYYRAGLGTKLGFTTYLYLSFSNFSQTVSVNFTPSSPDFTIKQPDYYAQLRLNVTEKLFLRGAYHFMSTRIGTGTYNGHLFLFALAPDLNRFMLEMSVSAVKYYGDYLWQPGLKAGYLFPGRSSFYVKGSAAMLMHAGESNAVVSPEAGFCLLKGLWLEGHASFGKMNLYNDFNGLYVYNSYDPMIRRSGAGMTYYLNDRFAFWLTFAREKKEYFNYSSNTYNQFSYLGGIKFKI